MNLKVYRDCIFRVASDDAAPFRLPPGHCALLKGITPAIGTEGDGDVVLRIDGWQAYRASRAALADLAKRLGALDQAGAGLKALMDASGAVAERIVARQAGGASQDELLALCATRDAIAGVLDAWGTPTHLEKCHYLTTDREMTLHCEWPNGEPAPGRAALDLRMLVASSAVKDAPLPAGG